MGCSAFQPDKTTTATTATATILEIVRNRCVAALSDLPRRVPLLAPHSAVTTTTLILNGSVPKASEPRLRHKLESWIQIGKRNTLFTRVQGKAPTPTQQRKGAAKPGIAKKGNVCGRRYRMPKKISIDASLVPHAPTLVVAMDPGFSWPVYLPPPRGTTPHGLLHTGQTTMSDFHPMYVYPTLQDKILFFFDTSTYFLSKVLDVGSL